jgi:hypothetical protein
MRRRFGLLLLTALTASAGPQVDIITFFDRIVASDAVRQSLDTELRSLFKETGLEVQIDRLERAEPGRSVRVFFRGACRPVLTLPRVSPVNTPLAWIGQVHGQAARVIHIDCSRIAEFIASSIQAGNAERQYGRALARVLAHELYHYLTSTNDHHSGSDLFGTGVRAQTLLADKVGFSDSEVERLQAHLGTL